MKFKKTISIARDDEQKLAEFQKKSTQELLVLLIQAARSDNELDALVIGHIFNEREAAAAGKNLAFLQYTPNPCHAHVVDRPPDGVVVDTLKGTWSFENRTYKLGQARHCDWGSRGGIIGVYYRTTEQLNRMLQIAQRATQSPSSGED